MHKFLEPISLFSIPKSTLSLLLSELQDKVTLHIRLLLSPCLISQSGGKYVRQCKTLFMPIHLIPNQSYIEWLTVEI